MVMVVTTPPEEPPPPSSAAARTGNTDIRNVKTLKIPITVILFSEIIVLLPLRAELKIIIKQFLTIL